MKKTLIAVTVLAGIAGMAHAESTVTLYGIVDGGVHFSKEKFKATLEDKTVASTTTHSFGITEGFQKANRFGLMGNEDLGNGMNAMFKLEGGFSIVNGASKLEDGQVLLFGRKAYLGLSGPAGTLTAGLQGNAVDELAPADGDWAKYDFFGDIGGATIQKGVKYVSPDLQGFQFAGSWTGTNEKDFQQGKIHHNTYALSFAYNLGSFSVSTGLSRDGGPGKPLTFIAGASYDFGPVAVFGRYGRANMFSLSGMTLPTGQLAQLTETEMKAEAKANSQPPSDDELNANIAAAKAEMNNTSVNVLGLALSAPVTETGTVFANYQYAWANKNISNDKVKTRGNLFNLAYVENLSKRTSVYTYGGYKVETVKLSSGTGKVSLENTELAVGLTHKF